MIIFRSNSILKHEVSVTDLPVASRSVFLRYILIIPAAAALADVAVHAGCSLSVCVYSSTL